MFVHKQTQSVVVHIDWSGVYYVDWSGVHSETASWTLINYWNMVCAVLCAWWCLSFDCIGVQHLMVCIQLWWCVIMCEEIRTHLEHNEKIWSMKIVENNHDQILLNRVRYPLWMDERKFILATSGCELLLAQVHYNTSLKNSEQLAAGYGSPT